LVGIFVAPNDGNFDQVLDEMNKATRAWTEQAARGECMWICSDCSCSFPDGMPDECLHGHQSCTDIIKRDKAAAKT
jgi:hypothetical protein